jgi:hypothetical protein
MRNRRVCRRLPQPKHRSDGRFSRNLWREPSLGTKRACYSAWKRLKRMHRRVADVKHCFLRSWKSMAVVNHFNAVGTSNNGRQQCVEKSSNSAPECANSALLGPTPPKQNGKMADLAVPHDIRAKQEQLARLHAQAVGETASAEI